MERCIRLLASWLMMPISLKNSKAVARSPAAQGWCRVLLFMAGA